MTDLQAADIEFLLWHQLNCQSSLLANSQGGPEFDRKTVTSIIGSARQFAENILAPESAASDLAGCHLDAEGCVRIPAGYVRAWKEYRERGFPQLIAPKHVGGLGFPYIFSQAVLETLLSRDPSFVVYSGFCVPAIFLLELFGSASSRGWCTELASANCSACLCLTESQAGSDLANITTRASRRSDNRYIISGRKCFVSAGMHDLTSNILYLVLARTSGSPPDSAGLSCFLVPRFRLSDEGDLVDNGVKCRRVERTMGMRGCPTAELEFGLVSECQGELLGEREGRGLSQLRSMMNDARIMTATFSVGIAAAAFSSALSYAQLRAQGAQLGRTFSRRGPPVLIIEHADVRRMLLEMKARVEGCRALLFRLAWHRSKAAQMTSTDGAAAELLFHEDMIRLLTPVLKAYASEQAWLVSALAIQVHGGLGYISSMVPERCARDSKILSIWEGTNYIQALDLIGEKLSMGRQSRLFDNLVVEVETFLGKAAESSEFNSDAALLGRCLKSAIANHAMLGEWTRHGRFDLAAAAASRILDVLAQIVVAWLLLDGAMVANRLQVTRPEDDFLIGKIAAARFYCQNILPYASTTSEIIQSGDLAYLTADHRIFKDNFQFDA